MFYSHHFEKHNYNILKCCHHIHYCMVGYTFIPNLTTMSFFSIELGIFAILPHTNLISRRNISYLQHFTKNLFNNL